MLRKKFRRSKMKKNRFGTEPLQIQTNLPDEIATAPSTPTNLPIELPTAPSTPTNAGIQNSSLEPPRLVRQNARPGYYEQNENLTRREIQFDNIDDNDVYAAVFDQPLPPLPPRQQRVRREYSLPSPEYNSSGGLVQFGKFVKKYMKLGNSRERAIAKYNKASKLF